jgi:hypothetical protein
MRMPGAMTLGAVIAYTSLLGGVSATPLQSAAGAGAPESATARVAWLLFADDLHLDFVDTGRLRDLLRAAAAALREEDALIGLRSSGPSMVSYAPSTSRTGLEAAFKGITGNALKASDFLVGPASRGSNRELRYRAHTTLSALQSAVTSLANAPTPHKQILFVSHGFTIVQPVSAPLSPQTPPDRLIIQDDEVHAEIAAVAQAALDAGVTISALDPRAFMAKRSDPLPVDEALWRSFMEASHHNLRELTMATGGSLLDDNQPLPEVMATLRARVPR